MSVRKSIAWTYLAQITVFLINFSATIIIARTVSPRDYGIYVMAGAFSIIINVFMSFGLAKYLMREDELSRERLQSLFTVNVMMSVFYSSAILIGGLVYSSLGSEDVGRFLFIYGLYPLIGMMEFIPAALCAREMRFGIVAAIAVLGTVVNSAVTIFLAFKGFAYMSFAWGVVAAWIATSIAFNAALWRPDVWRLRFTGAREILHFGTQMIGISGISQLNQRAGDITLGSMLGLATLGLYNRASNLPNTLYATVFGSSGNVIFSRLSRDLREKGEFHENYLRFMRLLLSLLWPMMMGIAVLAQPIIATLYGAKWQAAATPLSLLMTASAITVAIGMTAEIFILRHQTKRQVRIEIVRGLFGYTAFAAGATVSLTVAALAKMAEAIFAFVLYRKPMSELVGGPRDALRSIYLEALLVTAVAVLPALALMMWWKWSPATPLPFIAAAIALGIAGWALLLVRLDHPVYQELMRVLEQRWRKAPDLRDA